MYAEINPTHLLLTHKLTKIYKESVLEQLYTAQSRRLSSCGYESAQRDSR